MSRQSKRGLEFLDLPTPVKRAKLDHPEIREGFSWSKDFGYVRFASDGTQYKEIPLMLPFAVTELKEDDINPVPFHNWNNLNLHICSEALTRASLQALSETLQAITFDDRATARFAGYLGHSRAVPFNYHTLPRSQQWIAPVPFNKTEETVSKLNSALYVDYPWIRGAYFPKEYFGLRQSFLIDIGFSPYYTIRRGTKVILANVFGSGTAYFATRIRFIRQETAGVEIVAISSDGSFYDDTSPSWPPVMLEVPVYAVNKDSFGDWVPSINDTS